MSIDGHSARKRTGNVLSNETQFRLKAGDCGRYEIDEHYLKIRFYTTAAAQAAFQFVLSSNPAPQIRFWAAGQWRF